MSMVVGILAGIGPLQNPSLFDRFLMFSWLLDHQIDDHGDDYRLSIVQLSGCTPSRRIIK